MSLELVVATKNRKKFAEIVEILKGLDIKLLSLCDYPHAPEIIENGRTFEENAVKKAVKIARYCGKLTMGEDSGLCVPSLGNRPGVRSARFSGKDKDDKKNNQKLLRLLKNKGYSQRKAYYACAVAVADKGGLIKVVSGKCYGVIADKEQGNFGFGYDPLFVIPKYKKTFGQLGPGIKHAISHRFRALKKINRVIQKYIEKQKTR